MSSPIANDGIRVKPMYSHSENMKNISESLQTASLADKKDPRYRDWLETFWSSCEQGCVLDVENLISKGVDVNSTAGPGDWVAKYGTGLVTAVQHNHVEVVRCLLKHGARANQPGNPDSVCLPLHTAAFLGHKTIVKILLNNKANIHAQGGAYRFALTAAAAGGHIDIMRLLIDQGAVLNARDMENETALHGAVQGGHLDAVKFLIDQGIDKDVKGDQGTALEMAINLHRESPGFGANVIRYLSGGKIDPSPPPAQKTSNQRPNISVDTKIAEEERTDPQVLEILKILFQASLLFYATKGNLKEVTELLADGVDPNGPCENDAYYGYSLHAAAANGHWKVVVLLLENGANVNTQGRQLGTALHFAAYYGHIEVILMLVAWGAEVNIGSDIENLCASPLEFAAAMGHVKAMTLLVNLGAQIDATGGTFGSPLHAAASSPNSLGATQYLLSQGANVLVRNAFGLSAADIARASEHHDTKELLKRWGCPRATWLSPQRAIAWLGSITVRAVQQQAQQRDQQMQDLIQQYAAAVGS
jgi:ankyrin repeat protein